MVSLTNFYEWASGVNAILKDRQIRIIRLIGVGLGILGLGLLCFTACIPQPEPQPTPTTTPVPPTVTFTPTIVWSPPTATFTPYPTLELLPTEDLRPGIGALLFQDDFSDPDAWSLSTSIAGSVALGLNELTIAIGAEDTYLYSLRKDWLLSDFYLELTASPSMCRDLDEYGILLRVSPELDFYRFSLSCDGQMRLDRIYHGAASSPQPWMLSGAVPPGAPSMARLGVWAVGSEMRFFVNDRYQFTVRDPLLVSGGVGGFARSTVDWPVTVNFSDLAVYTLNPTGE
jgi:hypothetical protein